MSTTTDLATQAAALAAQAEQGIDIYESAVSLGNIARLHKDSSQYILGSIALGITTSYGDATMSKWSAECGLAVSSARHYRRVVGAYGFATCLAYAAKNINYTFLRNVVFAFKDDAKAAAFMESFVNTPIGDEPPPLPKPDNPRPTVFLDIQDARICDVNVSGGFIVLNVGNGVSDLVNLPRDVEYHLVIKEVRK